MVETTESSKKVLNEKEYSSSHTLFLKNFDQKAIWFNRYSLLRIFCQKETMPQPILSFKKILT